MIIAPIDDGYIDRRATQSLGRSEPAETGAEDDNLRPRAQASPTGNARQQVDLGVFRDLLAPGIAEDAAIDGDGDAALDMGLEAEYPGLKPHIERGIAVSINGRIFRDSWGEKIPENAEVYLLPRIAGG